MFTVGHHAKDIVGLSIVNYYIQCRRKTWASGDAAHGSREKTCHVLYAEPNIGGFAVSSAHESTTYVAQEPPVS